MVAPDLKRRSGTLMVPGYNTGVTCNGVEFHVQTEDLGARTAAVLTLVYKGGAIVGRQKTDYRELLGEDPAAADIKHLIDAQHQEFVRRAAAGDFAAPPPPAAGPEKPAASAETQEVDRLIEDYLRRRAARKSQP